jgi:hypothetical protein
MAAKKTAGHETTGARKRATNLPRKAGTRPVRLDLDEQAHRDLRLVAAADGLSMAAYANKVVMQAIADGLAKLGRAKG